MTILVCPLSQVGPVVGTRAPERIITLLDPERPSPYVGPNYRDRHLRLSFHDVDVATWDENVPTAEDVRKLLAFARAWQREAPLLIHCHSGVGRSPAAALAVRRTPSEVPRETRVDGIPFELPSTLLRSAS
jgi:predicted protein tyrosine phosphatase